jgi:hypothetical protein
VPAYPYNPTKSKQLAPAGGAEAAGEGRLLVPTSVSRPYMPNPANNFQAFAADLDKAGFDVSRPLSAVEARLPGRGPGRQGPAVPVRLDRRLPDPAQLPGTSTSGARRPVRLQESGALRLARQGGCGAGSSTSGPRSTSRPASR